MKYIYYKKKLVNGKKRKIYKKNGSKKLYLKYKGRMVNLAKYKKKIIKKKGGFINLRKETLGQRMSRLNRNLNNNISKLNEKRINNRIIDKRNWNSAPIADARMLRQQNRANNERKMHYAHVQGMRAAQHGPVQKRRPIGFLKLK